MFRCNRCGTGGGVLHLYAEVNNISINTAYEELCRIFQSGEKAPEHPVRKAQTKVKQSKPALELASVEARDNTYSNLLSMLSLGTAHREALLGRGLSGSEIIRLGYKTTPAVRSAKIVTELLERGCDLKGVPGFYVDEETGQWKLDIRAHRYYGSGHGTAKVRLRLSKSGWTRILIPSQHTDQCGQVLWGNGFVLSTFCWCNR